jgi:hypothetical protein
MDFIGCNKVKNGLSDEHLKKGFYEKFKELRFFISRKTLSY